MKHTPEEPIRRRILIPLSLTFAVLFCTFIYSAYQIRADQNLIDMRHNYEVTQAYIDVSKDQRETLLLNLMIEISHDPQLRKAMMANDRDALYQQSLPLFNQFFHDHGISHFYYHTTAATTLLRVHNPDEFGDKVARSTFLQAAHSQKFAFGLELGKFGMLTYRGVLPWQVGDKLIGYIELGIEVDYVLKQLQSIVKKDFLVTLDKQQLDREQWELAREHTGRSHNWDLFSDQVIAYQTLPDSSKLNKIKLLSVKSLAAEEAYSDIVIDKQIYRIKGFPLFDFSDQLIGGFYVLHNITQQTTSFKAFIVPIILASASLCLVLFFFAYTVLGRMDRQLAETRKRLNDEVANVTLANRQLEEEIGHRRLAESELQLLNQTLEERVAQRTVALEEMNRELQETHATILHQDKMACIGQLAAGIAHDINNPIGFVSHNLDTFERYLERLSQFFTLQIGVIERRGDNELAAACMKGRRDFGIDEILREMPVMLAECRDGTTRISQTVQGLRNFSCKEIPRREFTDLHQCIDSTLALIRHELHAKIEVVRDYGNIPRCYCCAAQMNQVFLNLFINATQAIAGQGKIHIQSWAEDKKIWITISDNGCGIPPDQLEHIFEPFFTTKEVGVGTGLGLSIVYDIVTRHKGIIEAVSKPGTGTTFTLCLPIDLRTKPRDPNAAAPFSANLIRTEKGDHRG
ncbi:MAG: ATP-binding protein [Deltaproteobacteria bacterium]|nr:ATP-binding protein [Deltaproteobacteria bacterium]